MLCMGVIHLLFCKVSLQSCCIHLVALVMTLLMWPLQLSFGLNTTPRYLYVCVNCYDGMMCESAIRVSFVNVKWG